MQIAASAFAIGTSAFCLKKCRQASIYLWKYYYWYAAIMCFACFCTFVKVGALIATERSLVPAALPSSTLATDDKYSLLSASQRYLAIFSLFCAFEFATMSIAELLVLHRYLVFAFKSLSPTPEQLATSRFLFVAGCVVVAFNISNIVAGCTVMYYRTQTSRSLSKAAAAYGLDPAADYESAWYSSSRNADVAAAAQNMFEVLSLFIKAAAFVFIGRLDLKRLEQAKQLLPVRAWCNMSCRCRDSCACIHPLNISIPPSFTGER